MSKIIVTGGAGFIGSHLVDKLVGGGHDVFVFDDLSGGKQVNINPKSKFINVDLRDVELADKYIKDTNPHIIYHLAANAAENKAQFSPVDITSRNYSAFINTLTPFIKYGGKRFIFTSSIAVYGALQAPFKETDKPEPEDLYGITKLAAEQTLKVMSEVHGFEYVITRPHNCYGPRQNMNDPYRNVVTIFLNSLLKKEPYHIYGDGEQRRCFSYIEDVVNALLNCGFGNFSGMTFNIGADKDYSVNDLSKVIQDVVGVKIKPIYLQDRPQEVKIAIAEHALAKKYLGYEDKTSLKDGIKKTWDYAKRLGYQKPNFSKIEINSPNLPKNWRID